MTSNFHHGYILTISCQNKKIGKNDRKLAILQTKTWKSLLVCKIPYTQITDMKFRTVVNFMTVHICANFQVASIYSCWNIANLVIFGHFLFWSVKYTSVRKKLAPMKFGLLYSCTFQKCIISALTKKIERFYKFTPTNSNAL